MSAMDKLRQWLKEESKPADIDAKNLSLAQKLLELKDARIQALQDQLWAVEEENKLLKEQLALFGSPLAVPSEKKRRVHLELFDAPSATRSVGMRWELLARGELLKLILAYLRTTSYLKLLTASRQVQEDFARHWSYELDLTNLKSRGGLQSFHKFLALPRWKGAKILRMPKDDQLGLSYRWPISSMSHIMTCLPNLQELDLLSFGFLALAKWPEADSTRAHFAQSFSKLSTLKLALAEYKQADMLTSLSSLRVLHLGLPYCHPTLFGTGSARTLFTYLARLGALESLTFVGHRSAISKDGHLLFTEVTNDIKQLLIGCSRLQSLAIVPCVGLSEEVFGILMSHGKNLRTVALYVSSAMTLQSLPLLNACPLLRHLRLAREGGLEECGFVVPSLKNIQVTLDPLVDPNFFHSETVLE